MGERVAAGWVKKVVCLSMTFNLVQFCRVVRLGTIRLGPVLHAPGSETERSNRRTTSEGSKVWPREYAVPSRRNDASDEIRQEGWY